MRILFTKCLLKTNSGGSIHFQSLVKALVALGCECGTFCDSTPPFGLVPFRHTRTDALRALHWADLIYRRFNATSPNPGALSHKLELVRRLLRKPLIWEVNSPVWEAAVVGRCDHASVAHRESIARRNAKHVAAAIAVSQELEQYCVQTLRIRNVHCIPNGGWPNCVSTCDIAKAQAVRQGAPCVFLWMGSAASPWEGLDLVLAVAREFHRRFLPGRFVLIGGGHGRDRQYPPNVTHLGTMPHDEALQVAALCDVGLCLYNASAYHPYPFYNSPLKMFDFMATGLAIVATPVGQIARILRDGEHAVYAPTVEAVVRHCIELMDEPSRRIRLGRAAQSLLVRKYTWRHVAERTIACCETVQRLASKQRR